MSRCPALGMLAVLFLVGCADESDDRFEPVRSDSAGVEIVMNPASAPPARWTLGAIPELRLGDVDGEGPEAFGFVAGAAWVGDVVVVADPMNSELRAFDRSGTHRYTVGARGEGPQEFMGLAAIARLDDETVAAYDEALQRITLLSIGEGRLGAAFPLRGRAGSDPGLVGVGPNRTLVFRDDNLNFTTGITRGSALVTLVSVAEEAVDTVGIFAGMDIYSLDIDGERRVGALPFGRTGWFASSEHALAYGPGDAFVIDIHDFNGELSRSIRTQWPREPVDGAALEEHIQRTLRGDEDPAMRRRTERLLDALTLPRDKPAHSYMTYDDDGNLWVSGTVQGGWVIFDPDGALLAHIDLPDRTFPLQIGSDILIALQPGDFDDAQVVVYSIEKPS